MATYKKTKLQMKIRISMKFKDTLKKGDGYTYKRGETSRITTVNVGQTIECSKKCTCNVNLTK